MEKRGQRRTREGNCFREGSVGLTGEERRELVVEVLFLCSYRDYKDCNASNSEKSDQRGRPARRLWKIPKERQ